MTEMFGEAWSPMSVPDLAPDDDDDNSITKRPKRAVIFLQVLLNPISRRDSSYTQKN